MKIKYSCLNILLIALAFVCNVMADNESKPIKKETPKKIKVDQPSNHQTTSNGGALHLVDANGNDIGAIIEFFFEGGDNPLWEVVLVYDTNYHRIMMIDTQSGKLSTGSDPIFYYENADCEGPARYVSVGTKFLIYEDLEGKTFFSSLTTEIKSFLSSRIQRAGSQCVTTVEPNRQVREITYIEIGGYPFPAPLSVELR
jgi:hypothetical protein